MVEAITTIDKAGRVVIPEEMRERMNLEGDSAVLLAETGKGVLILKKLDVKEIADRLRVELKEADVDNLAGRVEEESNARVRRGERPKTLRGRLKRLRLGGGQPPAQTSKGER